MHVVHVYDGHEKVYNGRGSVPNIVWHIARETAATEHDVTVVERQWEGLDATATHDGVAFDRLDLRTGADEPWTRVPYETVGSLSGMARLVGDRTNFALAALRRLRHHRPDVVHVHLPFAANVLVTLAPWLRDRMVYTAHLGELRIDALDTDEEDDEGQDDEDGVDVETPVLLEVVSPDRYLAKRVAQTTVLNPDIERSFATNGVPADRLRVIPNGVDIERFGGVDPATLQRVSETYGLDPGRPLVLFVGTLMPRKGVTELVKALLTVVDEGPLASERPQVDVTPAASPQPRVGDAPITSPQPQADDEPVADPGSRVDEGPVAGSRPQVDGGPAAGPEPEGNDRVVVTPQVILAGENELDGEYVSEIETLLSGSTLEEEVQMPGFVPKEDLPALYTLADLFVMPSLEEGFGMCVVEAMAAGTPVVASRAGAMPRIVEDGRTGRLVDTGDVDGLAAAIGDLLSAPDERERMGERGRHRARDFSWPGIGRQFIRVYAEVAE